MPRSNFDAHTDYVPQHSLHITVCTAMQKQDNFFSNSVVWCKMRGLQKTGAASQLIHLIYAVFGIKSSKVKVTELLISVIHHFDK